MGEVLWAVRKGVARQRYSRSAAVQLAFDAPGSGLSRGRQKEVDPREWQLGRGLEAWGMLMVITPQPMIGGGLEWVASLV